MKSWFGDARVRRLACYASIVGGLWLVTHIASHWVLVGWNRTASLPGLLYIVKKYEKPRKGDLVAFFPPANPFYSHTWFVKQLVGEAGDVVTSDGRDVHVSGRYVATAKETSKGGVPLKPPPTGTIPADHFFACTGHPDGFDSRYGDIGFLHVDSIIGRAHRVF
jgi:conjugal transfer pilin signal peptidase TrbI